MISFADSAKGSAKIRLACSKVLLLICFDRIASYEILVRTDFDGYIKGNKYFLYRKSRCSKCSVEIKLFIK